MSNFIIIKYADLKKIEDSIFISTLQTIKNDISNFFSPIPNRINAINLLRSLCKFQISYFYNFFWGIRFDFSKTCLNYVESPKLQEISIFFINEILNNIYNEVSHENTNDFIFWAYNNIFQFLSSKNNILQLSAQKLIKDVSQNIPSESIIISLIKSLEINDENQLHFIFNCIELYFREFLSYGLNFDYIIESLEIETIYKEKDYYKRLKKVFSLFNTTSENKDFILTQINESLNNKNRIIFNELIK